MSSASSIGPVTQWYEYRTASMSMSSIRHERAASGMSEQQCRAELVVPHGHAAPGDVRVGPGGKYSGGWGLVLLLHGAAAAKHQHQGTHDDAEHLIPSCAYVQACEVGWWEEGCMSEAGQRVVRMCRRARWVGGWGGVYE